MSKLIMIVEDDPMSMELMTVILHADGYQTIESPDGQGVLQLTRLHMPDLILMDMQLPKVSGLDITKSLKAEEDLKHIPVMAVTAFALKGDREEILAGGCDYYVSKPIIVPEFMKMLGEILS